MQPMNPDDVQAAFSKLGLDHIEITFFKESTATSQEAADQIGCELGQIVKSLGFIIDGKPILVLGSGDGMIDDKKLAAMYSVGRKKVKVAKPEQLIDIYGYAPGCMPPFGHRTPDLTVYVDVSLKRFETVYAAGGAANAIFEILLETLVEKSGGRYADVRKA